MHLRAKRLRPKIGLRHKPRYGLLSDASGAGGWTLVRVLAVCGLLMILAYGLYRNERRNQAILTEASGRRVWRLGAFVTSLSHEPFGPIGCVDVDAETGVVLANETSAEEMAQRGERLARGDSDAR